ncbi:MAG: ArsA family ATPase [Deltaproteobacteria bacterium]|nr:ArsA family ATPase [Deltaproteobacteria bacterium]
MSTSPDPSSDRLAALLRDKRVIVLCGAGGVGKTTTSAALALAAADRGRRVLVLTVDPARRLAEALGIPPHADAPTRVPEELLRKAGVRPGGALDAWMLDPRIVFENLVKKLAPPEKAKAILDTRLYRHLTELVAGMQEYTAAEALHTFAENQAYDLIVLDTPPSRNALDFLDAPGRLSRFLDEGIVQMFLPREGGGLLRRAGRLVSSVFVRMFGETFVQELQIFLGAFSGMFSAIRAHTEGVRALLGSDQAAFLLVSSPETAALHEAHFFRTQIEGRALPFKGFVLNRSHARAATLPHPSELTHDAEVSQASLDKLKPLADRERSQAIADAQVLDELRSRAGAHGLAVAAPHLGDAVEDLSGLHQLAQGLLPERPSV